MLNNKLEKIYESFGDFENFEVVDFLGNYMENLSDYFNFVYCVLKFYVDRNKLIDVFFWLVDMKEVLEIFMSDN